MVSSSLRSQPTVCLYISCVSAVYCGPDIGFVPAYDFKFFGALLRKRIDHRSSANTGPSNELSSASFVASFKRSSHINGTPFEFFFNPTQAQYLFSHPPNLITPPSHWYGLSWDQSLSLLEEDEYMSTCMEPQKSSGADSLNVVRSISPRSRSKSHARKDLRFWCRKTRIPVKVALVSNSSFIILLSFQWNLWAEFYPWLMMAVASFPLSPHTSTRKVRNAASTVTAAAAAESASTILR